MAEELTLAAESGRPTGSRPSGRLRRAGLVPGVVYGHGMDPLAVSVAYRELRSVLSTEAGMNAVIDLRVDGQRHLTIVRDLQRDPVRHDVLHVDFGVVSRTEEISVDVPIVLEGDAEAVRREQGVVEQALFNLPVTTTPLDIPNGFTVDISGMSVGDTIRVGDLALPPRVTTEVDPEEAVAVAQVSRATIEADQLEAEAEAAEQGAAEEGVAEGGEDTKGGPGGGGGGEPEGS